MKLSLFYVLKEILGFILRTLKIYKLVILISRRRSKYFVFNYHGFSKYNNYKVKRGSLLESGFGENFEKQIRFLKRNFVFSYPQEFFESAEIKHSVLLTFDDGYKDNFDIALPILVKHNAKAIFFIITELTDTKDWPLHDKIRILAQLNILDKSLEALPRDLYKGTTNYDDKTIDLVNQKFKTLALTRPRMMSTENLKAIVSNGFNLGNHTHSHKALSFLTQAEQQYELKSCDKVLKQINHIDFIAYPNGLYNSDTILISKSLNYSYGFTILPGVNDKNTKLFELKRIGLNPSDSLNVVVLKIVMNYIGLS